MIDTKLFVTICAHFGDQIGGGKHPNILFN